MFQALNDDWFRVIVSPEEMHEGHILQIMVPMEMNAEKLSTKSQPIPQIQNKSQFQNQKAKPKRNRPNRTAKRNLCSLKTFTRGYRSATSPLFPRSSAPSSRCRPCGPTSPARSACSALPRRRGRNGGP